MHRFIAFVLVTALIAPVRSAEPQALGSLADTTTAHNAFSLLPTREFVDARLGRVTLTSVWSPFGVTVDVDGHMMYDLTLLVPRLPAAAAGKRYVAWLTTPTLEPVERIGVVTSSTELRVRTTHNKMLVVISLEDGEPGTRWDGPIALRGRSKSALLRSLMGHSIFRRGEM